MLETVTLPLVMQLVVLLVTVEIRHAVLLEDSSIMLLRLVMPVMHHVPLAVDQQTTTV